MKFVKYNSIENTYKEKTIQYFKEAGLTEDWVVTIKTDGANFSFITDGKEVKVASRSQIVTDQFFNCQKVVEKYEQAVLNLFSRIADIYAGIERIQLYGELVGDGINSRVKYTPDREFIVFDLMVNDELVEHDFIVRHCKDFPVSPIMFVGSLDACIDYCSSHEVFNSPIPTLLNSKYKDLEENIEEGYVLKPIVPAFLGQTRVILKHKNERFKEKQKSKKPKTQVTEEELQLMQAYVPYITESRLHSVLSKFGKASDKDFGKILKLYLEDLYNEVGEVPESNINKLVTKECVKTIRPEFVKVV